VWSVHFYCGFNFGVELYADTLTVNGRELPVEYFLINLGFIRIQRGEYI